LLLKLWLDANLFHFIHLGDALFQVLGEFYTIVFVASVESD
jgi:hypothetical protein